MKYLAISALSGGNEKSRPNTPAEWRALCTDLRRLGFRRVYTHRATQGCPSMAMYEKTIPDHSKNCAHWDLCDTPSCRGATVTISVQLWGDGGHRIFHAHGGHENTVPTEFHTLHEMRAVVAFEELGRLGRPGAGRTEKRVFQ